MTTFSTDPNAAAEHEESRLAALHRYALLDTPREDVFDDLVKMAAFYFDVSSSALSLIDRDRIWFKASLGLDQDEISRSSGLCATTIEHAGIHHLADARLDEAASRLPLVAREDGIRFYAGHALETHDGYRIGSICVMSPSVRELSEADREFLSALARLATGEIERRYAQNKLTELNRDLDERVRMRTHELDIVIEDLKHEAEQRSAVTAALQLSDIRQRRIAELSADFCFEIELGADIPSELKWTTGPIEAVTGYRLDEFNLLEWTDYVHEEDRPRLSQLFQNATGASNAEMEYRFRCRDGGYRWFRMHLALSPSSHNPGAIAFLAAVKDLHGQRSAEDLAAERSRDLEASRTQLRESRRLAWLGTIAAGMAHQINNPIGAVLAAAQLALLVEGERDERAIWLDALRTIEEEARRCGRITHNVLQFARREDRPKRRENLVSVTQAARDLVDTYALEKRVRLELECDAESLPVHMNRTDIEEMIVNLVRNAIESEPSSAVEIRIDAEEQGERARLRVIDDGRGISGVLQERIFDPFVTTRFDEGGTGLGLSVAHGVVIDHLGEIDLDSRPGRGTTVTVRLPLDRGPDPD